MGGFAGGTGNSGMMMGSRMDTGGMGGFGNQSMSQGQAGDQPPSTTGPANDAPLDNLALIESGVQIVTGKNPSGYLVSLDTELPLRGQEFFFSTPRGATEITAQSISANTIQRTTAIIVLLTIAW